MNEEYSSDKETHSRILSQENSKTKKKRVSFSICNANTVEEMESLRKQREMDFMNIVKVKTAANKHFEEESMTFRKDDNKLLSRTNPIGFNEIVKAENIFLQNHNKTNNLFEPQPQPTHEILFSYENTHDHHMNRININTLNSDTLSVRSPKENILFSEEREQINSNNSNNKSELIFSQDPLDKEQVQEKVIILSNKSLENIKLPVIKDDYIEEEPIVNINNNCVYVEEPAIKEPIVIKTEENNNHNIDNKIEASIKTCSIYDFSEILFSILGKFHQETKLQNTHDLINNLRYISNLESFLLGKTDHFLKRKNLENFVNKIKNKIKLTKYSTYNNLQADKYLKYRNYKRKLKVFEELKFYSLKRKEWIQKVHKDIKRITLW